MDPIYDPIQFVNKAQILTIVIVGSFITIKFLNAIYENIYEPVLDNIIDSEHNDNYYIKIGKYYVQIGMIIKEFIKWLLLIVVLMIFYNVIIHRKRNSNIL